MTDSNLLTIHLFSFGYRYSGPPADASGHGGGFVFDCRALPNPYWEEQLRPYHGGEAPIVAFMERQPVVAEFAAHAAWLVRNAARTYTERGYERLMVAFGCTGGRHRSVYQVEQLRTILAGEGYQVVLTHLDLDRAEGGAKP